MNRKQIINEFKLNYEKHKLLEQKQQLEQKQKLENNIKIQNELKLMAKEDYNQKKINFYKQQNIDKLDMYIEYLFDCFECKK